MKYEVKVPSAGESVTEVFIGTWLKKNGESVKKGEVLVDLETQKATFEIEAEASGVLEISHGIAGEKVAVGDVIATIDDSAQTGREAKEPLKPAPSAASSKPSVHHGPAARKLIAEKQLDSNTIVGSGKGGRILKEDLLGVQKPHVAATPQTPRSVSPYTYTVDVARGDRAVPATRIRRQIADNLVRAQHTAAILTTFNEVDMSAVLAFRKEHRDAFEQKHGVSLGMVGFFAFAAVRALKLYPLVNATFTGEEIIYHDYIDLSVAVSTDKGLVVPVIRDIGKLDLAGFEKAVSAMSEKARLGKLSIPEMSGGTFTISNGGVFGSLVSTPLLNMPQSAILGLHKIEKRPVVVDDKIEIRPMMYLALSYDHRIIDGKDAVQFLVAVKQGIEELKLMTDQMI